MCKYRLYLYYVPHGTRSLDTNILLIRWMEIAVEAEGLVLRGSYLVAELLTEFIRSPLQIMLCFKVIS